MFVSSRHGHTEGVGAWLEHALRTGDPRMLTNAVRSLREQGRDIDDWDKLRIVRALVRGGHTDLAARAAGRWVSGLGIDDVRGLRDVTVELGEMIEQPLSAEAALVPALVTAGRHDLARRLADELDVDEHGVPRSAGCG